jgi:hypothetical protein
MRARIDSALGLYWGGIAQAIDVLAAISALGAIGGAPALLGALIKHIPQAAAHLSAPFCRVEP